MPDTSVRIELKDLVMMMAGEVARQVSEELRKEHIEPLNKEVALIKLQLARPTDEYKQINRWDAALGVLWKVGLAAIGLTDIYHNVWRK